MLTKIDHIGIAVYSIEKGIDYYENVLGLYCEGVEDDEDQKIKVARFKIGDIILKVMCPVSKKSPIYTFLEKNGEGIHHLSFESDDINDDLKSVCDEGIELISKIRSEIKKQPIIFLLTAVEQVFFLNLLYALHLTVFFLSY